MGPKFDSGRGALNYVAWVATLSAVVMCCIGRARDRAEAAKADTPLPPSHQVRVAAARVRVRSDHQVGRSTARWIVDLAQGGRAPR